MSDIDALRARLRKVKRDIENHLPDIALTMTISAKTLVERKIRDVGFGAQYSNNKLPAFFFEGKAKSNAGEAYVKRKEKEDAKNTHVIKVNGEWVKVYGDEVGMTWGDLRRAEGLPTDHVDLGFTNKMWAGIGPMEPYYQNGIIVCPLGANSTEAVKKLNWNRERYGDFFAKVLQTKEMEILRDVVIGEIKQIFTNNGF